MIEGWKEHYVRDVFFGGILCAETADDYDLIPSGVFVSPCFNYSIRQQTPGKWSLFPEKYDFKEKSVRNYFECPECSSFRDNSLEEIERLYNKYLKD